MLRWRPIESNPDILSSLSHSLGLSKELSWHDIYSLDDPELLSFVPRPIHALLLVYPASPHRSGAEVEGDVVWVKQTIGNACGTMGVLHCLLNSTHLDPAHPFTSILEEMKTSSPQKRINIIESNDMLREAHERVAGQGQSATIDAEEHVTLHYVAWVNSHNALWQLDGDREGPVLEASGVGEDILEVGLSAIKRFIEGIQDVQFSICALGPS